LVDPSIWMPVLVMPRSSGSDRPSASPPGLQLEYAPGGTPHDPSTPPEGCHPLPGGDHPVVRRVDADRHLGRRRRYALSGTRELDHRADEALDHADVCGRAGIHR
jgi:hypothetical protein